MYRSLRAPWTADSLSWPSAEELEDIGNRLELPWVLETFLAPSVARLLAFGRRSAIVISASFRCRLPRIGASSASATLSILCETETG